MPSLYLIVPIVILLVALAVWLFMWAVKSGQFEDLEGPAHRILLDDDLKPDQEKDKNPD
ncbi:MAG: cbb3-type cytochrome oxidase assembly protein CcoS [Gammaproteobacteria bacterium]|nr:cbb3-type cytochrome oxidase assembly protein CcoS [Gammaproteobacteria bacterium]MDH5594143.1 cbb3-type cytochrome oxidase assembly protein CcoS [Gammaproteobacteria bacterium]MDH5614074.1 cbb3-type cytochrome oxidase assembly protein CcoS [Gammaproteobacteria bacterium]